MVLKFILKLFILKLLNYFIDIWKALLLKIINDMAEIKKK